MSRLSAVILIPVYYTTDLVWQSQQQCRRYLLFAWSRFWYFSFTVYIISVSAHVSEYRKNIKFRDLGLNDSIYSQPRPFTCFPRIPFRVVSEWRMAGGIPEDTSYLRGFVEIILSVKKFLGWYWCIFHHCLKNIKWIFHKFLGKELNSSLVFQMPLSTQLS